MTNTIDRYYIDSERSRFIRPYVEHLYKLWSLEGHFMWFDGKDDITAEIQRKGCDVGYTSKQTHCSIYIDEKADYHKPYNFCLETESNTTVDPEIPGWMRKAQSHRLLYAFVWLKNILDVYVIDFPRLKRWFWPCHLKYREYIVPDSPNKTRSRLVPIGDVAKNVPVRRYLITLEGLIIQVAPYPTISEAVKELRLRNIPFEDLRTQKDEVAECVENEQMLIGGMTLEQILEWVDQEYYSTQPLDNDETEGDIS